MHKRKLLIVEDETDLQRLLRYNFESQGYEVSVAKDAESSLQIARRQKPDLMILDIMLPKMDGLELCRILREETDVPILFLTARKSEMDRIMGFRLGADDYVIKPFSIRELLVRVEAIMRRFEAKSSGKKTNKRPGVTVIGAIQIDGDRHEVKINGRVKIFPPKEYALLKHLIKADGRVMTREQLLERIWGHEPDDIVDTRTVDQHVARLRRKLGRERTRLVTVTNEGYRLVAD
jgi:DNA-binding response OmpR family regulator